MYHSAYDPQAGVLVGLNHGELTRMDHIASMEAMAALDRDGARLKKPLITVLFIEPDAGQPSAQMRKEYAESQERMTADRHVLILVTTSTFVRGVVTAVNWIKPPTVRFKTEVCATIDEAIGFAEKERGESVAAVITALASRVRRKRMSATQA